MKKWYIRDIRHHYRKETITTYTWSWAMHSHIYKGWGLEGSRRSFWETSKTWLAAFANWVCQLRMQICALKDKNGKVCEV